MNNIFATYPYLLSDFQKYAIEGIYTGNHVLTCAPTGSGKTLAAEFAIQYFQTSGFSDSKNPNSDSNSKNPRKKVIYTSPIKALSNQKYHEFSQKYPHISFGLLTGDIKTNPGADVLIMTTEILMNKLFMDHDDDSKNKNNESMDIDIQTELACVIFDEVHYINDADRGHVWEQTIILLPQHVQMVMLSATIDDPVGFAEWCENTKTTDKKVYLAYTNHREVPLTHYAYWATTEDPFKKIKDKSIQQEIREKSHRFIEIRSPTGKFSDDAYHTIGKLHRHFNKERIYMKRSFVLNRLCENLRDAEMLPAIAFVFSRKNVEICAKSITTNLLEFDSKVPYTMSHECEKIIRKFANYKEYAELPEYTQLVSLLEKGIGIHHSGMIPVLRELVEIMISRKHVKLLFATESFAIGLDCPIRTAIFTDLCKFDNQGNRALYSHEYTQMAGRAGRRGIDTVGHVVHCNNLFELPPLPEYQAILSGKPQKLVSKFHISYSGILSFLESDQVQIDEIEEFMQKSMLAAELRLRQDSQKVLLDKVEAKMKQTNYGDDSTNLKHPLLEKYMKWKDMLKIDFLSHKKKKEIEKEMAKLKEEFQNSSIGSNTSEFQKSSIGSNTSEFQKSSIGSNTSEFQKSSIGSNTSIETEIECYSQYLECAKMYAKESEIHEYTQKYISTQIENICYILEKKGLIEFDKQNELVKIKKTLLGKHTSLSAEIPAIIMGELLQRTDYFADYDAVQFIRLFSTFTQIKVNEDAQIITNKLRIIQEIMEEMIDTESQYQVATGIHYEDLVHYDLVDEMAEWCACENEYACKLFIQGRLADKGITVGDFTKAVLKISTITREVSAICELAGKVDRMHILSQIDGLLLKYVTTAQSLYI
jgi:superfamily II RNA helicase